MWEDLEPSRSEERPSPEVGGPPPAVKTMVEIRIDDPDAPLVAYSRIVGREGTADFLDALKGPDGQVLASRDLVGRRARMAYGDASRWFSVPVEITEMLDPLPLLEIRYLGAPRPLERRESGRIPAAARGVLRWVSARGVRELTFVTRDVAPGGVRVVVTEAVDVGQRVEVRLAIASAGEFRAVGTILRATTETTRAGDRLRREVVVRWDQGWSDEDAARWLGHCTAQRWAGSA